MRHRAFALVDLLILVVVAVVLITIFIPTLGKGPREQPPRSACASNLRQIYTAMYEYSGDYNGAFPRVPFGSGLVVGEDRAVRNLKPKAVDDPWKDFGGSDNHSISQNLWLLVRSDFIQPEVFGCSSSKQAGQRVDLHSDNQSADATYYVDFPFEKTSQTICYSFIQPWSKFGDNHTSADIWRVDADPRFVLGADANDGSNPAFSQNGLPVNPDDLKAYVNSRNHAGDGQNVMSGDGHVAFQNTAYTGIEQDNIYTALPSNYTGTAGTTPGIWSVRPGKPDDTVLIPNRDADLAKWNRRP